MFYQFLGYAPLNYISLKLNVIMALSKLKYRPAGGPMHIAISFLSSIEDYYMILAYLA